MTRRGILPIGVVVALCGVVACLDREPSVTNIPGEPPSNSDPWPNQPAAFREFAENDFSRPMVATPSATGLRGSWSTQIIDGDNTYVRSVNAPKSPPSVFQGRLPAGMIPGYSAIKWEGWDSASDADNCGTEMSRVYLSLWVKLPGADYENQAVGTKMGFFAYGEPKTGGGNQGVLFLKGLGTGHGLANAWNVQFKQQGSGPPRDADQNVTQSKLMTVGSWHRWEVLLQLNDTGQANGVFKWWIDGTLVLDYEDWTYITSSNPLGFYTFRFWPYWGGVGGENKTRDDYIQVDHIYISGIPKTSKAW